MEFENIDDIKEVLRRYRKDFTAMDSDQIKDVAESIGGFLADLKWYGWDWDKWNEGRES